MISVAEALSRVFDLARPMPTEIVPLAEAAGRVLAADVAARQDQPPFRASVMDGYALRAAQVRPGTSFRVIGEAAAGGGFSGTVPDDACVRIFTGAPLPEGTNRVVIQEDVVRHGDTITLGDRLEAGPYVRLAGADFKAGDRISAPRVLRPSDLALLASMGHGEVSVARRPIVALIATGDELVMPGETPGPDQIIASNTFGLKAMIDAAGGHARMLPIARDIPTSLQTIFGLAAGADLIVTIGGASVGDYDLVAQVAESLGLKRVFYKIAMRPGKPLMAGKLGESAMIGLPGNPVSSMVCGHLFVLPLIRAMLGLGNHVAPRLTAPLACDLGANGSREHYMRARLTDQGILPFDRQDSALLSVLAQADALLVRPVDDRPRRQGDTVEYVAI